MIEDYLRHSRKGVLVGSRDNNVFLKGGRIKKLPYLRYIWIISK